MNIWIIELIVVGSTLLILLPIGIFIAKSEKIYIKESGRWIPGFNLPRLHAEEGDIVDHEGFRNHVGRTIAWFGVLLGGFMGIFVYIFSEMEFNELFIVTLFMLLLIGLILFLVYMLFTYSERYIQRVNSKKINYHKYIYQLIIAISIFNTVPYMIFPDDVLIVVLVSIALTFVAAAYYIYKIYVILKDNKKDFL